MYIRIADLFCGIGGIAEAAQTLPEYPHTDTAPLVDKLRKSRPKVVTAIDIDRSVASLYQHHHGLVPRCSTIESLQRVAEDSDELHSLVLRQLADLVKHIHHEHSFLGRGLLELGMDDIVDSLRIRSELRDILGRA